MGTSHHSINSSHTFVGQAFLDSNPPNMQYDPPITSIHSFCPSQQPQLLTQQHLNTGQAYTVQEQSLIQNYQTNFSHGNGSQPNFSGASSVSFMGLDFYDFRISGFLDF